MSKKLLGSDVDANPHLVLRDSTMESSSMLSRNPIDRVIAEMNQHADANVDTSVSTYAMNFENYAMNFENYAMNFENYAMNFENYAMNFENYAMNFENYAMNPGAELLTEFQCVRDFDKSSGSLPDGSSVPSVEVLLQKLRQG